MALGIGSGHQWTGTGGCGGPTAEGCGDQDERSVVRNRTWESVTIVTEQSRMSD
jgi:hypothetical protein